MGDALRDDRCPLILCHFQVDRPQHDEDAASFGWRRRREELSDPRNGTPHRPLAAPAGRLIIRARVSSRALPRRSMRMMVPSGSMR